MINRILSIDDQHKLTNKNRTIPDSLNNLFAKYIMVVNSRMNEDHVCSFVRGNTDFRSVYNVSTQHRLVFPYTFI